MSTSWHSQSTVEIFQELESTASGLTSGEAERRLLKFGLNALPVKKADSFLQIFARQFASPLIYLLLFAGVIIYLLHGPIDSSIIFFVLIFNAVVGALQEGRAQNTLNALKIYLETKATVYRNSQKEILNDIQIVPGDLIWLQEGERVPADARLVLSQNLTVNEAPFSGESVPVHKITRILPDQNLPFHEQKNMVFKGTYILAGSGKAVVVATGGETAIGSISRSLQEHQGEIPLKKDVEALSRLIILVVAIVSVILALLGLAKGRSFIEMAGIVVSLAVSVIPEGLPVVLTLILSTGVWRMSKRNALIKRIQAVEGLGQVDIIAVDKTGTITKNEMTVTNLFLPGLSYTVEGAGYQPEGIILQDGKPVNKGEQKGLIRAAQIAAFCSNAYIGFVVEKKEWLVTGDPTEAAMQVFAQKVGIEKEQLLKNYPLIKEWPFDYKTKIHACLNNREGSYFFSVTGAPEVLMEKSKISQAELLEYEAQLRAMSEQGLRVVAFAYKEKVKDGALDELLDGLSFGGLFGMKDPLHEEVRAAVAKVEKAGVKVVLITGDYELTARAIAKEAGIYKEGDTVISGKELILLEDHELAEKLMTTSVFCRVAPDQKMRIIQAYQAIGKQIAMTGDGVNDAPSLVAADLGISMGKIGTEVAKEASDITLLDDNFKSIVAAIEEGRNIYQTIKKVIAYLFSTGIGETVTIAGALLLSMPQPLQASQIIWLNFVTDGFLTAALAMEPKESGLLQRKRMNTQLVDKQMIITMTVMGFLMAIVSLIIFTFYVENPVKASTMALTTLAAVQWYFAWSIRTSKPVFNSKFIPNPYLFYATVLVIIFQILAVYVPALNLILHTTPLFLGDWVIVIITAGSVFLAAEGLKYLTPEGGKRKLIALTESP